MSLFDRILGKKREAAAAARRAELEGDLTRAAVLWAEAERADEAARVMLLRGDGETDSTRRLQLYVQAVAIAPAGHLVRDIARKKRALLALGMAKLGTTSAAARQDLLHAGEELEALGESAHAAEAYALAGDVESQARALVQGGDVERLEDVLDRDRERSREERRRADAAVDVERLVESGQRREALARADHAATSAERDASAMERASTLRARRVTGARVALEVNGARSNVVLGDEIVIGRSEATITVASPAISRRHVAIARESGRVEVRDLGSRNGTELRGMRIAGTLPVALAEGLELRLGGEVPLRIAAAPELPEGVLVEVAGERYVAPLGVAKLGVGEWRLERGPDDWVELVTDDAPAAFLGTVQVGRRTPLLSGDAFARARGGPVVLRVA